MQSHVPAVVTEETNADEDSSQSKDSESDQDDEKSLDEIIEEYTN